MTVSHSPRAAVHTMPLWLRVVSRLPWGVLYAFSSGLAWLIHSVFRYRLDVVRGNLTAAFPQLEDREITRLARGFYRNICDLLVEVIKSATMAPEDLRLRVAMPNLKVVRDELDAGNSVMILGAHQCNWEWMLHGMSLDLGYPVDAAYKPLRGHGERAMRALRSRFGGRMVPAKELLTDIMVKRSEVRAVAALADQEPFTAEYKWWTQFLDRQTAFYMGPEKIARAARFGVIFAGMRRLSRGHYEVRFERIAKGREPIAPGAVTERYARLVEAEIRANPSDWMWSHRRWRLRHNVQPAPTATQADGGANISR